MDLLITQFMISLMPAETYNNYELSQLQSVALMAQLEVEEYCGRTFTVEDRGIAAIIARIAVIKLNKIGADGLASQSFSGVSESYIDGLPADIMIVLNRKRKVKVL